MGSYYSGMGNQFPLGILIPDLMMTDDLNRMISSTHQFQPSSTVDICNHLYIDISGFAKTVLFAFSHRLIPLKKESTVAIVIYCYLHQIR